MRYLNSLVRAFFLLAVFFMVSSVDAQQYFYMWQDGNYTRFDRSQVGEMPFTVMGSYLNIGGVAYDVLTIDSLTFTAPVLDLSDKVVVRYAGNTASVTVPAGVSGVTYQIQGAHVTLTSANTVDELEYVLQGESSDGSLLYYGDYKCKFYLNGLDLTSAKGAAVDLQCGKRIELILQEGKDNYLKDCAGGVQKAALNCDGHLEIEDGGTLTVAGKTGHAIRSNEYLRIKRTAGRVVVTEAVKDGLHCGQYFQMNGGYVSVSGSQGDCIQAELTKNPQDEFNGQLFIKGGKLDLTVAGNDMKGLKSDRNMTISGGEINIKVPGNGSKGISSDVHLFVNETDAPVSIDIQATGDTFLDAATGDVKKCMGIKVDFNMTVGGGRIKVVNTGKESSGIKVAGTYTKTGGTVEAQVEAGVVK